MKLELIFIITITFLIGPGVLLAKAREGSQNVNKCNEDKFNIFHVKRNSGTPADTVQFHLHPEAQLYAHDIQLAYEMQPEQDGSEDDKKKLEVWDVAFASRYPLSIWDTGQGRMGFAVVDAKSGEVVFYSENLTYHDLDNSDESRSINGNINFRPYSYLLIINPKCGQAPIEIEDCQLSDQSDACPHYYSWDGARFKRVHF